MNNEFLESIREHLRNAELLILVLRQDKKQTNKKKADQFFGQLFKQHCRNQIKREQPPSFFSISIAILFVLVNR